MCMALVNFGFILFFYDPFGGGVVSLDWGSWIFVSHFIQYNSDVDSLSCYDL